MTYRPPLDKIVRELPAGLTDESETADQAAIRELEEETCYVAEVLETSPVMSNGKLLSSNPLLIVSGILAAGQIPDFETPIWKWYMLVSV
ncbi:hypothetical protein QBC43DRAFT_358646 [Cladorrhinum sp. PSN259]|nr:hypothetical protein QBC43DRAFT_358646 [Cladorrhinum sp. PSN259]